MPINAFWVIVGTTWVGVTVGLTMINSMDGQKECIPRGYGRERIEMQKQQSPGSRTKTGALM